MKKVLPMLGVLCLGSAFTAQAYYVPPTSTVDADGSHSFDAAQGAAGNTTQVISRDSKITGFGSGSTGGGGECTCTWSPECQDTMDAIKGGRWATCAKYTESDLPEWDYSFFGSVSRDHVDYRISPAAVETDSDVYTVRGGFRARKEKLSFATELRYSLSDGKGAVGDSQTYGLLLLPGYQLLSQREQLVNLHVYGILDVSYLDRDDADNQWRLMPGVGAAISRFTSIGLFSVAGTFNHSRNLNGDTEVSGDKYINLPELIADYTLPIGQKFYVSVGAQHSYAENVSSSGDNRFTEIHLTPVGYRGDVWGASLALSQSVDGNDNSGIAVELTRAW